jgi:hypothetical protein
MDQKARVVNRFGVYLLLKVVLHEIKNILQHLHRLHGLRHVVALALAVNQMKGDIPASSSGSSIPYCWRIIVTASLATRNCCG